MFNYIPQEFILTHEISMYLKGKCTEIKSDWYWCWLLKRIWPNILFWCHIFNLLNVYFFFSKFSHCLRYRCIGVWREKYIPQPICLDLGSGEEVGRIQLPNVHDFWIKKTIPLPHKTNPEAIIVSKCYILKMTTPTMRVGRNDKEMAVSQRK